MRAILLVPLFAVLGITVEAQVPVPSTCQTVYLPDLAPPEGVPTVRIEHTFRVGPSSERPDANGNPYPIFYPFDLSSIHEPNGSWTVNVIQKVGPSNNAFRQWKNVQSVSLISIMAFVYPYRTVPDGNWEFVDAFGNWTVGVPNGTFLLYQTMPHVSSPEVIPSWAYRFDDRTWTPTMGRALSDRLEKYAGWNVGIYADSGVQTAGLQVKALICGDRQ